MNNQLIRLALLIFAIIYFISPDLVPGPIDDILVFAATMYARNRLGSENAE